MWAAGIWLIRGKVRGDGSGMVGRGQIIQGLLGHGEILDSKY